MTLEHIAWRPIRPDDADRLIRMHGRLSPHSLYLRFFTPVPKPNPRAAAQLVAVDHDVTEAIVALDENDEIIGVARYYRHRDDPESAEVAVIVTDDQQGHGVGRFLLTRLAILAQQRGIHTFTGSVLSENTGMIHLARSLSPQVRVERHGPDLDMVIPLAAVA
jgi:RimJ/RimL family protein N-acetyltransferase